MSAGAFVAAGRARVHRSLEGRNRARLFDFELDAEIAELRRRIEANVARKRRHDLVNAFTAVEGAALIMTRETLSPSDRSTLAEVLGSGLSRLRGLLLAVPQVDCVTLSDLATAVVEDPRWRDRVHVELPPDLVVAGSPGEVIETVSQLLTHATRHTPPQLVAVRGFPAGDRIELWVDDRGPGLSGRDRFPIGWPSLGRLFGRHTVSALDLAERLARGQGGVVRVQAGAGGGESFGVSWPAHVA